MSTPNIVAVYFRDHHNQTLQSLNRTSVWMQLRNCGNAIIEEFCGRMPWCTLQSVNGYQVFQDITLADDGTRNCELHYFLEDQVHWMTTVEVRASRLTAFGIPSQVKTNQRFDITGKPPNR